MSGNALVLLSSKKLMFVTVLSSLSRTGRTLQRPPSPGPQGKARGTAVLAGERPHSARLDAGHGVLLLRSVNVQLRRLGITASGSARGFFPYCLPSFVAPLCSCYAFSTANREIMLMSTA